MTVVDETPPVPSASGPARQGMRLGRYILGGVLGQGAMATVFRARDEDLGRTVAVKVMNLAIASRSDSAQRFRREAQAVAALKHPGIVEIYDFAAATDDEPSYIVVELVEGPTLSELLAGRRGRVLPEVAALIAAPVAEALAVAHGRGIFHRDVKPDNVMIEKTATGSRVVLTDFGVAHVTGLETMTATGALVGSPAYMSPEQARGRDAGPGADTWAMGVLLYQMVTGVLPFPGREPLTVLAAIARGEFRRPSQVAATVGPEIEQIVLRCLKAAPAERYGDVSLLAADLRKAGSAAGIGEGAAALRRFLDDPEGFEANLRPQVAAAAVERARRHSRRGEIARALAEIGRAMAYVPGHAEAGALLASISARQRWMKVAGWVAAAGAIAAGVVLLAPKLRSAGAPRPAPVVESAPKAAPAPLAPLAPIVAKAASPPPTPATKTPRARRPTNPRPNVDTEPLPVLRAAAPAAAAPSPPPPPAPAALPPVEPPRFGDVKLLSQHAFCDPSLDDRESGPLPVHYQDVSVGSHDVYCRLPGGAKRLVGRIQVVPGRLLEVNIIKDQDGPKLGRTRPASL